MYTAYLQTSQLISGILEDRPPDSFTAPFRKRIRVRTPNAKAIHSLRMDVFGPQEWAPCVTSHPYLFSGEIPYIYTYTGVSRNGGIPKKWKVYNGKSQSKMDVHHISSLSGYGDIYRHPAA